MSSQWTNKYAIMRDLSLAQGFALPMDLNDAVEAGEKPPILKIPEENNEFFDYICEDGDENTGPDLKLIQHMLRLVYPVSSDSEDDCKFMPNVKEPSKCIIEISKPARNGIEPSNSKVECVPDKTPLKENNKKEIVKKVKKKRVNVAVDSILQGMMQNDQTILDQKTEPSAETMKLLKPTDFTVKDKLIDTEKSSDPVPNERSTMENSIGKVNHWLSNCDNAKVTDSTVKVDTLNKNGCVKKYDLWNFDPASMFRRKKEAPKRVESTSDKTSLVKIEDPIAHYKPSELADEYYKKYLENSKLKEAVKEDIWMKAEKKMKEMDAKKAKEAESKTEAVLVQLSEDASVPTVTNYEQILLPQHRHLLTGDCLVCEIVKKNGIDIDLAILENSKSNIYLFESSKLKLVEKAKP